MSGGFFDYKQYDIDEMADKLRKQINKNKTIEFPYSDDTIKRFKIALKTLRRASKMMHCIDWLLCSDTSEDDAWTDWPQ